MEDIKHHVELELHYIMFIFPFFKTRWWGASVVSHLGAPLCLICNVDKNQ